jgi:hypothetical protein
MNKRDRFPLCWPIAWKRTQMNARLPMKTWKTPFGKVRDSLFRELELFKAEDVIVSTNLTLNRSGLPYDPGGLIQDPGVAVYFSYKKRPMCIACDLYRDVTHNLNAIRMTVQAIRGIERWGASQIMERAFSGFAELPEKTGTNRRTWRQVFELDADTIPTPEQLERRYRDRANQLHPDKVGGDRDRMAELNVARDEARRELALES